MNETTLAGILETITTVVTSALDWVGLVLDEITSNPVLLIFCIALPLVGLGIALTRRLIG